MTELEQYFPEWHIEKQLGRGSYGTVYKVTKNDDENTCAAIKVICVPGDASELDSLRSDGLDANAARAYLQEIVNDFVSEIRVMELLRGCDNIVGIEEYKVVEKTDEISFRIYIRMELLTPFNSFICDKKLTEDEVIKLGCDICTALSVCREHNIIHRDIKPENILLNDFGDYKLGDFGVARSLEQVSVGLSQKGTFNYIAPEVVHSGDYDARADIYSLGIVLYRLLNKNRFPFLDTNKQILNPSERKAAVDRRLRGEELPPPCEASPAMAEVILKACAYEPAMRYATADEFRQALLRVRDRSYRVGGKPKTARKGGAIGSSSKPAKTPLLLKIAIPMALVCLAVTGGIYTYHMLTTAVMPNVVNTDGAAAVEKLTDMGFLVETAAVLDDTVPAGRVISQDVDVGARIPKNEKINLTVSLGEKSAERIFISRFPESDHYVGDSLDTSGLELTVRYNDGTEEVVTSGFTCTPDRFFDSGLQVVTLSFDDCTTRYGVSVWRGTVTNSGSCGDDGENVTWSFDERGTLVLSGEGDMKSYENITDVPWYAFRDSVKRLIIGEDITSLGDRAFYGCTSLTETVLPEGITSIGTFAFFNCQKLKEIYVPENVTAIGASAFGMCTSMERIIVDEDNRFFASDEVGVLYDRNMTVLYKCPVANGITEYTIPSSVDSIFGSAFRGTSLVSIDIPTTVNRIGDRVFWECADLKSATVYNREASFDSMAFADTHPEFTLRGYTGSTADAYADNNSLKFEALYVDPNRCGDNITWELHEENGLMVLTGSGDMWDFSSAESAPWYKKRDTIRRISVDEGITSLGDNAFRYCGILTEVTIPQTLTDLGANTFEECPKFKSIKLSENNRSFKIVDGILYNSRGTELIKYPAALAGESFTVPEGVTAIAAYAFSYSQHLVNVTFPSSLDSIGEGAFKNSKSLGAIVIPEGVTSVDRLAFWECDTISAVTLPASLTWLGTQPFGGCESLEYIKVAPDNKNYYTDSDGVLYNKNMTKLIYYPPARQGDSYTVPLAVTELASSAFHDADNLETVKLHNGIKTLGWSAFLRCDRLTELDIPASVTSVSSSVFRECPKLRRVTVRGTNVSFGDDNFINVAADFTLYAPAVSTAHTLAVAQSIPFVSIGVQK